MQKYPQQIQKSKDESSIVQGEQTKPIQKQLKIFAVGDTHGSYYTCQKLLEEEGDIFIHVGDFTYYGFQEDFTNFFDFLDKLKFKHKIVIAGNHEIALDNGTIKTKNRNAYRTQYPCKLTREEIIKQIKKRAIYLQHQEIEIQGLKVFGSPYTPIYYGSAFQYEKQNAHLIWDEIPEDLDILITHGPPYDILDANTRRKTHGGCQELLKRVQTVKPKVHVFGHIHQSHGIQKVQNTKFMNVSYKPQQITFD